MSTNNAENGVGNELINKVAQHDRWIRESKTSPQPVGAESLKVGTFPASISTVYIYGPYTVAAGSGQILTVTFTPSVSLQTLWSFQHGLYIDAFLGANAFPNGSALTGAQRTLTFSGYDNITQFNSTTNAHAYTIVVRNLDTASHNYWITLRAFVPLTTGATVI